MNRILLVDDQREVLVGLRRFLTESFDDIDILEAYDGAQGYELALQTQPDVIVADIMMADIDGLKMIQRLKKEGVKSRVIILSAHERFDYAKQAIELGVDDYIVKPVTRRQIYLSVIKQLHSIKNSPAHDMYCDVLLNEYLSGADIFISEDIIFEMSGLSGMDKPYWMIGLYQSEQMVKPHFLAGILVKMETKLKEWGIHGYLYHTYGRRIFAIINLPDEKANECMDLLTQLLELLPDGYYMGSSTSGKTLSSLCGLYHQAEIAAEHARLVRVPFVLYDEISSEGAIIGYETLDRLISAINCHDQAEAWTMLDQQITKFALRGLPVDSIKIELSSLTCTLDSLFCQGADDLQNVLDQIDAAKGLFSLKRIVNDRISKWVNQETQSQYPPAIQAAIAYIEAHLSNNLTVAQLANTVNLSYYYFSALFTRSTGATVKEYLLNRRLACAAELIRNDITLRVGEIAQNCGFTNVNYFSACFKKKFGMTPQQYRTNI